MFHKIGSRFSYQVLTPTQILFESFVNKPEHSICWILKLEFKYSIFSIISAWCHTSKLIGCGPGVRISCCSQSNGCCLVDGITLKYLRGMCRCAALYRNPNRHLCWAWQDVLELCVQLWCPRPCALHMMCVCITNYITIWWGFRFEGNLRAASDTMPSCNKKQLLVVWIAGWFIARWWALECIDWQSFWLQALWPFHTSKACCRTLKRERRWSQFHQRNIKTIAAGWFLCTGFSWKQLWADSGFTFRGARRHGHANL